jgi:hypothetical protein
MVTILQRNPVPDYSYRHTPPKVSQQQISKRDSRLAPRGITYESRRIVKLRAHLMVLTSLEEFGCSIESRLNGGIAKFCFV